MIVNGTVHGIVEPPVPYTVAKASDEYYLITPRLPVEGLLPIVRLASDTTAVTDGNRPLISDVRVRRTVLSPYSLEFVSNKTTVVRGGSVKAILRE